MYKVLYTYKNRHKGTFTWEPDRFNSKEEAQLFIDQHMGGLFREYLLEVWVEVE